MKTTLNRINSCGKNLNCTYAEVNAELCKIYPSKIKFKYLFS